MPVSCVAFGCTNRFIAGQQIHFFRFPLSNESLTQKWVAALRRKNFKPSQSSRICSEHFAKEDFQLRPGAHRPLLKDDIVPSIFPAFPSYYQNPKKCPRKEPVSRIQITNISDPCSDQSVENTELDTFGRSCDKGVQTISTITNEEMLKKKIKVLQQKLKRQKIKIDNLSNFLNSLKQKGIMDEESNNFIANNFNGN